MAKINVQRIRFITTTTTVDEKVEHYLQSLVDNGDTLVFLQQTAVQYKEPNDGLPNSILWADFLITSATPNP